MTTKDKILRYLDKGNLNIEQLYMYLDTIDRDLIKDLNFSIKPTNRSVLKEDDTIQVKDKTCVKPSAIQRKKRAEPTSYNTKDIRKFILQEAVNPLSNYRLAERYNEMRSDKNYNFKNLKFKFYYELQILVAEGLLKKYKTSHKTAKYKTVDSEKENLLTNSNTELDNNYQQVYNG